MLSLMLGLKTRVIPFSFNNNETATKNQTFEDIQFFGQILALKTWTVLTSGSVFTEKFCLQRFSKNLLCNGSVKASKLTKSLYLEVETIRTMANLLILWFLHPSK